jgi:hypothetical protein
MDTYGICLMGLKVKCLTCNQAKPAAADTPFGPVCSDCVTMFTTHTFVRCSCGHVHVFTNEDFDRLFPGEIGAFPIHFTKDCPMCIILGTA